MELVDRMELVSVCRRRYLLSQWRVEVTSLSIPQQLRYYYVDIMCCKQVKAYCRINCGALRAKS